MDLPKDKAQELLESKSRRNFLKATGSLAAVVGIASGQIDSAEDGNLTGGAAMLEEAYQVGPRTWMGPDSAKASVEAKTGRKYEAIDTQVQYWAENGNWEGPLGIGSDSKSVPMVNAEYANNARFVDAAKGAAEVQSVVDSHTEVRIYSTVDPVPWSETVEVGDDTTVKAWGDFTIQVPTDHNITPKSFVGDQRQMASVLTNKDWTNGNEGVQIEGFNIDVNGVSDGATESWAGAALYRCGPDSHLKRIEAENVTGEADLNRVGTVLLRCDNSEMIECVGRNCGYEGFGIQGGEGCRAKRCYGYNCVRHSGQIHADFDDPRTDAIDAAFENCGGDNALTVHGVEDANESRNHLFQNCTTPIHRVIGSVRGVDIEFGTQSSQHREHVQIQTTPVSTPQVLENITISGISTLGDDGSNTSTAVYLRTQADGSTIRNVTVKDSDVVAGSVVRPVMQDTGSTITNIRVEDTMITPPEDYSAGSAIVYMPDTAVGNVWFDGVEGTVDHDLSGYGAGNADYYSVINSDLSRITNPANGDGYAMTVNRQNNQT